MSLNFYCGKVNSQGGSKISLLNTLVLLKKEKQEFQIFVNGEGWFTKQLSENNIDFQVIKEPMALKKVNRNTNNILKMVYVLYSIPKLLGNWLRIRRFIKNGSNIVLNESRDLVLFLPLLFNKKVYRTIWMRSERPGKTGIFLSAISNRIIAVSEEVKNNIPNKYHNKVVRIYNFMNDKPIIENRKSYEFNIAVVGSIQRIKGQLDAVKVLKYLHIDRKIRLFLVGREFESEYVNEIKEYINAEGLKEYVVFTGHLDLPIEFVNKNIGIILVPSQTESFCRVAMEAASVGVPVVAYGVGGLNEVVIQNKTGFLVKKDDINGMNKKVVDLMSDLNLYKSMSKNARIKWEERFYSENIKEKLKEALQIGE